MKLHNVDFDTYFNNYPDKNGFFGKYGGAYVSPELKKAMEEITEAYYSICQSRKFIAELRRIRKEFQGRPTPVTHLERLSDALGGKVQLYAKREDLNHSGAHKLNHCMGEALLAKYMGKKKVIAETGAGQHGVALATAAAYFGLECDIYMGSVDIKKQAPNVARMKILGANVVEVTHGLATLKEAVDAANEVGATILYDAAHVLGLIAGKQFQDPLKEGATAMMASTHKTFPGPQGGIILSQEENKDLIDNAVFPGVVSNHHLHHLLGLGIATAEMLEFGEAYAKQTIKNAQALGQAMYELGFDVLCEDLGFTQSHQIAVDLSSIRSASDIAKELADNNVILNKNLLPGDDRDNSDNPSGIRIGTQEITRRGLKEKEMTEVAEFIKRVAVDKEDIADEVAEFMNQYTKLDYAFSDREAYQYHRL